jgi:hypothetical protein
LRSGWRSSRKRYRKSGQPRRRRNPSSVADSTEPTQHDAAKSTWNITESISSKLTYASYAGFLPLATLRRNPRWKRGNRPRPPTRSTDSTERTHPDARPLQNPRHPALTISQSQPTMVSLLLDHPLIDPNALQEFHRHTMVGVDGFSGRRVGGIVLLHRSASLTGRMWKIRISKRTIWSDWSDPEVSGDWLRD